MKYALTACMATALLAAGTASAQVWRVTYEFSNAQLSIENTPFNLGDAQADLGPGALTLEFTDSNGALVDGPVRLVYFILEQDFTAGAEDSVVTTRITSTVEFDQDQMFASGVLSGTTITWSDTVPYRANGTNTCVGQLCSFAGFEEGVPQSIDRTDDVQFANFEYATGGPQTGAGFSMGRVELPGNDQADTFLTFETREVRRVRVPTADDDPCQSYPSTGAHTGDLDCDQALGLDDILRMIQLYNAGRFRCQAGEDDAYATGIGNTVNCARHDADFETPFFRLSLSELLRALQLFNLGSVLPCGEGEDGFCDTETAE